MASTQQLDAGYISDADLLESEAQTAFEQMVSLIKELCGGTGDNAMLTLSSDAFGILPNVSTYVIDSEGATGNDTLKWISGTARDGQLIAIRPYNAGRAQTIFNGAGGAGQILTKNGRDFVLNKTGQFAILKYVASGSGYWEEWLRDETARIDQLPGARAVSSVSVSSSQITVDRGRHTVTSGTTTNIDQALGIDTFDHDGNLLILTLADTSYVRTLRHNQGTTGKFNLIGGASIIMVANAAYWFSKNGTTWDHIFTVYPAAGDVVGPASVTDGRCAVFDGATGKLLKQDTRLAADLVAGPATATDKAVALYDGSTGKLLKDGIAPGTAANVLTSDGTNWTSAAPAGSTTYTSSDQTITAGGALTLAHSLGSAPKQVWAALVCQTAEHGYSIGNIVFIAPVTAEGASYATNYICVPDATNLNIRYGATATPFWLLNKTTGAAVNLTNANWKVRFYAKL